METGGGGHGGGQPGYYGGRARQQPPPELILQPEWRRPSSSTPTPTASHSHLVLQPEWRRPRPTATASPSHPSNSGNGGGEEPRELLLQPEWRRSRPPTTAASIPRPTASFWNQNQGARRAHGSSSGGVERDRERGGRECSRTSSADDAEFWRPPPGISMVETRMFLSSRVLGIRDQEYLLNCDR